MIIESLLRPSAYRIQQEAEKRARNGITAFAKGPSAVREQLFKKLDQFSKATMAVVEDDAADRVKTDMPDAEDYPPHVNSSLYSVLMAHSLCTCSSGCTAQRHPARLRLRENIVKVDGYVGFDMVFSASPEGCDYWQDMQLRVSM